MSNFDEQSDQDVISFIRNTELASFDSIDTDPASPLDLVLPNNAKERASLTGAAPLVFADDVSAEHKDDVELVILFAQLATAAYIRSQHQPGFAEAYAYHIQVLSKLGWRVVKIESTSNRDRSQQLNSDDVKGSLCSLVTSLLVTPGPSFKALFALATMIAQNSAAASTIFERMSIWDKKAVFYSGTVTMNSERVKLNLGVYGLEAEESITDILFRDLYRNKASFYKGTPILGHPPLSVLLVALS
ncbi:hypothetical protein BDV98DRAFT_585487 [Pterulicium gracile]|uniref:Uncharacterized protein n=1 Tax=Pterulicium gracile TaxID=1884261 RepID=A0A5C3Q9A0_9AGAR|nr:hypothetical protein BDV98DRAFT_585487 [Pterula gracilis]